MKKTTEFKIGDTVFTDTHAVHQTTQKSLSRLEGKIVNMNDLFDIHVKLKGIGKPVGFSIFELHRKRPTKYKNEKL